LERNLREKHIKKMSNNCLDCNINVHKSGHDYYMVTEKLWRKVGVGDKMLCLGCFKKRLKRKFKRSDFIDVPVNCWNKIVSKIT